MTYRQLMDFITSRNTFQDDVIHGLQRIPKRIPCKYLYDERGARLFEEICELEEYYPTRTELSIMNRNVAEMASQLGSRCLLIEYGSGSGIKTRILLKALIEPVGYVPIDISRDQLTEAAANLGQQFPALEVLPVCADYTDHYELPPTRRPANRRIVYFPGSTIGNFKPDAAKEFLSHIREVCGEGGGLLIGVDLKKDKAVLEQAYNDAEGVTAAFNLNLLRRINRELNADCRVDRFIHQAHFNEEHNRIEMHLVSKCKQTVHIGEEEFVIGKEETIHTENSYKYSLDGFAELADTSGLRVEQVWTDEKRFFSVQYLEVA